MFVTTFGLRAARAKIAGLRWVWVSHHHPDHCAGLLGVLAFRARLCPDYPPLAVVGPASVGRWLAETSAATHSFAYFPFSAFAAGSGSAAGAAAHAAVTRALSGSRRRWSHRRC